MQTATENLLVAYLEETGFPPPGSRAAGIIEALVRRLRAETPAWDTDRAVRRVLALEAEVVQSEGESRAKLERQLAVASRDCALTVESLAA